MLLPFYKYQGTGNDFIIMDNRQSTIALNTEQIAALCDRRMGIGADGLMLLEAAEGYDFRMVYYNADGNESTMCGNGGRCIVAFAHRINIINDAAHFIAVDGAHHATINAAESWVTLQMINVAGIQYHEQDAILNTGSPHWVRWVEDTRSVDVFHEGRAIRQQEAFQPKGINVNFATIHTDGSISVRTYERGVEAETLSCGTGVTAVAIASAKDKLGSFQTTIHTPGGTLQVQFQKSTDDSAYDVWLSGPATFVFQGTVSVE